VVLGSKSSCHVERLTPPSFAPDDTGAAGGARVLSGRRILTRAHVGDVDDSINITAPEERLRAAFVDVADAWGRLRS
jgi:hypothetical protein